MINTDVVYQRVLSLANKEQRGYITPQEFNLFANQAQMDIFEQYFYDLNQFRRIPGNNTMYADPVDMIEEKIEHFHKSQTLNAESAGGSSIFDTNDLAHGLYRLSQVRFNNTNVTPAVGVKVEKTTHDKFTLSKNSPLTKPTLTRPSYYFKENKIVVLPSSIGQIDVNYIRKPKPVKWSYIVVGEKPVANLNASDYQSFELHPSEETKLVMKILQLAGIAIKDPNLYQIAGAEDNKNIQQEKQ